MQVGHGPRIRSSLMELMCVERLSALLLPPCPLLIFTTIGSKQTHTQSLSVSVCLPGSDSAKKKKKRERSSSTLKITNPALDCDRRRRIVSPPSTLFACPWPQKAVTYSSVCCHVLFHFVRLGQFSQLVYLASCLPNPCTHTHNIFRLFCFCSTTYARITSPGWRSSFLFVLIFSSVFQISAKKDLGGVNKRRQWKYSLSRAGPVDVKLFSK